MLRSLDIIQFFVTQLKESCPQRSNMWKIVIRLGLVSNRDKTVLVGLMENKLERIKNWLNKSGMKVNDAKTCHCLFYKNDTTPIRVRLNDIIITSKKSINVLGVIFDQKLQWHEHISFSISKSIKALNAIRLIRRVFSKHELLQLITSNFTQFCSTIQRFGSCQQSRAPLSKKS